MVPLYSIGEDQKYQTKSDIDITKSQSQQPKDILWKSDRPTCRYDSLRCFPWLRYRAAGNRRAGCAAGCAGALQQLFQLSIALEKASNVPRREDTKRKTLNDTLNDSNF